MDCRNVLFKKKNIILQKTQNHKYKPTRKLEFLRRLKLQQTIKTISTARKAR